MEPEMILPERSIAVKTGDQVDEQEDSLVYFNELKHIKSTDMTGFLTFDSQYAR